MSKTTNQNVYEEDELKKYANTWHKMQNQGLANVDKQISAYENQYGGNLFDVDANSFADDAKKTQFLTDRGDYGNLVNLRDTTNSQLQASQKAQAEKEAYANTRRMLMERYMPETLQAMGLTNTGLASNALLGMENNYNNYVYNAKQAGQAQQNDIMQSYRDAYRDYTLQRDADALAKFRQNATNFDTIKTALYNGEYDLDFALDRANTYGLSQSQKDELSTYAKELEQKALANTYKEQLAENPTAELVAEIESAKEENLISEEQYDEIMNGYNETLEKDAILAGRDAIKDPKNGNEYYIITQIKHGDRLITKNYRIEKILKSLGISDPYDGRIPNGTSIGWDIGKYITYYNGEWYMTKGKK